MAAWKFSGGRTIWGQTLYDEQSPVLPKASSGGSSPCPINENTAPEQLRQTPEAEEPQVWGPEKGLPLGWTERQTPTWMAVLRAGVKTVLNSNSWTFPISGWQQAPLLYPLPSMVLGIWWNGTLHLLQRQKAPPWAAQGWSRTKRRHWDTVFTIPGKTLLTSGGSRE